MNNIRVRGQLKELSESVTNYEDYVNSVIESIPVFSFDELKNRLSKPRVSSLNSLFKEKEDALRESGKIGNADFTSSVGNSILKFRDVDVSEVNLKFLEEYEKWMVGQKKSTSTISMYMRSLRAIVNIARKKGLVAEYAFETM